MRFRGPLKVMGWKHPNTNPAQGPAVIQSLISYLAYHPATARHIAEQFARRFVSDSPRPELIAKLAAEYIKAGTDIKPVLRVLFNSEDFRKSVGAKYRTGWEYLAAALRSSASSLDPRMEDAIDERRGTFQGIRDLRYFVEQNGGGPHGRATPDGQPDFMDAWLSGKSLLDRWNFNGILANGDWKGIRTPTAAQLTGNATTQAQLVAGLAQRLVGQQLQPGFTTAVHKAIGTPATSPVSQVQSPELAVRTVLSAPHLNYS